MVNWSPFTGRNAGLPKDDPRLCAIWCLQVYMFPYHSSYIVAQRSMLGATMTRNACTELGTSVPLWQLWWIGSRGFEDFFTSSRMTSCFQRMLPNPRCWLTTIFYGICEVYRRIPKLLIKLGVDSETRIVPKAVVQAYPLTCD